MCYCILFPVNYCDIVLQGSFTYFNATTMRVSNPCVAYVCIIHGLCTSLNNINVLMYVLCRAVMCIARGQLIRVQELASGLQVGEFGCSS